MPSSHRFCGMCGAAFVAGSVPADAVSGPGVVRRYRGPLILGSIGTVLLLAGGGVATAILSAVQLDAAPAILVDVFQPFIEDQVGGTVADGVADLTGTADGAAEASAWMLAGFVGASLVAALGALFMLIAGAWGANRAMTKRRTGSVAIPPAPIPPVYERPAFAAPAPPTVAVPRAPAPTPPRTVAIPGAPAEAPTAAVPSTPAEAPTVVVPSSEAPTTIQPPPPTGRRLG